MKEWTTWQQKIEKIVIPGGHWNSILCQVALEARALRLRTTEDHLAAEKKAAEETEALVMQRHQAALQALETKHQLGSLDFVNSFYFS